jgi:hypothetical protein
MYTETILYKIKVRVHVHSKRKIHERLSQCNQHYMTSQYNIKSRLRVYSHIVVIFSRYAS